jgi:hypothetical protein
MFRLFLEVLMEFYKFTILSAFNYGFTVLSVAYILQLRQIA